MVKLKNLNLKKIKHCNINKIFFEQINLPRNLNRIQPDHVYDLTMVPPKFLISDFAGTVKGRTVIRALNNNVSFRQACVT